MNEKLTLSELKTFLDEKVNLYNTVEYIETDPIQIPHRFNKKEDIEIAGFLAATIAWGNRKSIIKSADKMMNLMDNEPYQFVRNHTEKELKKISGSIHRTFNSEDFVFFIQSLQNIYKKYGGLENVFASQKEEIDTFYLIERFRHVFFEIESLPRTKKHISSPAKNSSAKRINMFLRWMVRKDKRKVDFGIWKSLSPSQLVCPLDVHSGNISRELGILERKQNDWKAVEELMVTLRKLDEKDPSKYDFALFGLGVFKDFSFSSL